MRGEINSMNPKTCKTFFWVAVSSILLGMVIMSPAGGFFLYSIAALCAVVPAIFSTKGHRIAGGVLLAVSLVLLAVTYSEYDAEMASYRKTVGKRSSEMPKPLIQPPQ